MMANNCFGFQPFVPNKVTKKIDTDEFIVSREMKETYEKQGDDVVRDWEVVETSKVKRDDYINSFADEVGLENILRKVSMTGDETLLNRTGRVGVIDYTDEDGVSYEKVNDITGLPSNVDDAAAAVAKGYELFKAVPDDLKNNRSFAEFVEGCSDDELKAYLKNQIAAMEGDNKNE